MTMLKRFAASSIALVVLCSFAGSALAADKSFRQEKRKQEIDSLQKRFEWWPTDAKPGAVKDPERGGYWWWPTTPGQIRPWGNRGFVYVYKIIFDYRDDLPPPQPNELRASLLIRKIVRNIKIYFDYDSFVLRDDATRILQDAVHTLNKNAELSILVTGNADIRGTEQYNEKLGKQRAESVRQFMLKNGIGEERIRIVSRGKLDAVAPVTDLVGMQKDRNAQFMLAEVQEVMLPYDGPPPAVEAQPIDQGKFLVEEQEKVESEVKVSTREYVVKEGDTLSKIAHEQLGSGHRWMYLYEINKDRIKNPDRLQPGVKLTIPVE
jgi:outer membrane protein OmpA-like peptidoglycan-associated protein